MLIRTEEFAGDDGVKMCREFFGTDDDNITCVVEKPVVESIPEDISEKEASNPVSPEEIQAQIILNQMEIIAKQNEQDEVLAEMLLQQTVKQQEQDEVLAAILLNQVEGGGAGV